MHLNQSEQLALAKHQRHLRPRRVEGVHRSARLISLEIQRARRHSHLR